MRRTGILGWAARGALALCLVPMSACLKDDSGSGSSSVGVGVATPLVWQDQSTAAGTPSGDTPLTDVWIDSTTVTASGAGAILPSIDEITYGFPRAFPVANQYLTHPLMTQSSAAAVVNPEDQILTLINNYRLQTLGQQNLGGAGGGQGGLGVPVGGIVVTAIPPSGKLRKNARAHCKHYGKFLLGALPQGANEEGDNINAGGVTPTGRLRKSLVTVSSVAQISMSGPAFSTAQNTFDAMVASNSPILTTTGYTYIGIGHWPQGPPIDFYWNFVLATGVNPVN